MADSSMRSEARGPGSARPGAKLVGSPVCLLLGPILVLSSLVGCISVGDSGDTPEGPIWERSEIRAWEPAGEWEELGQTPGRGQAWFASTEDSILMDMSGKLWSWSSSTSGFQEIWEPPGEVLSIAGMEQEAVVFLVGKDFRVSGVYRLNPQTGEIVKDPERDDDRDDLQVLYGAQAVLVGNEIYVVGGCCHGASVWRYDLSTYEFTHVATIPQFALRGPEGNERGYFVGDVFRWEDRIVLSYSLLQEGVPEDEWKVGYLSWHTEEEQWYKMPWRTEWPTAFVGVADGRIWELSSWCISELDPAEGMAQEDVGYPWNWPQGYWTPVPNLTAHGGVKWKGDFYIYDRFITGQENGSFYRWSPPDPEAWPYPIEEDEETRRAGLDCREELTW